MKQLVYEVMNFVVCIINCGCIIARLNYVIPIKYIYLCNTRYYYHIKGTNCFFNLKHTIMIRIFYLYILFLEWFAKYKENVFV